VETGTYRGDTVQAMLKYFDELHSIELDEDLFKAAQRRFEDEERVHLYLGDSGQILSEVIALATKPCLFWLDGHWSGAATARGEQVTPVLDELEAILFGTKKGTILIDDARSFTGRDGYPSLREVIGKASNLNAEWMVEVSMDIVRITSAPEELKGKRTKGKCGPLPKGK
jgi:hypothetical protein